MEIVDVHCHIECSSPKAAQSAVAEYRSLMAGLGIGRALVMPAWSRKDADSFQELETLLGAIAGFPELSAIANIDIRDYVYSDLDFLAECIESGSVRALKLYPGYDPFSADDGRCHVFYKMARHFGIPVMVHGGELWNQERGTLEHSHPRHMDSAAALFPDVPLVLCHLGNPFFTDARAVLYKNDNLYADGSGLFYRPDPAYLRSLKGELFHVFAYQDRPKVMFGTDHPYTPAGGHVEFWRSFFEEFPEFQAHATPLFSGLANRLFPARAR